MKKCLKCQKSFGNRAVINGAVKNLQNRKYCLECSSWGNHNTKKIHLHQYSSCLENFFCPRCNQVLSNKDFYYSKGGKRQGYCKACIHKKTLERQKIFKKKCIEYKGGSCALCGYNRCINALEFHHRDASQKEFSISNVNNRAFSDKIKKELDKCDMLCSNCHREVHSMEHPSNALGSTS